MALEAQLQRRFQPTGFPRDFFPGSDAFGLLCRGRKSVKLKKTKTTRCFSLKQTKKRRHSDGFVDLYRQSLNLSVAWRCCQGGNFRPSLLETGAWWSVLTHRSAAVLTAFAGGSKKDSSVYTQRVYMSLLSGTILTETHCWHLLTIDYFFKGNLEKTVQITFRRNWETHFVDVLVGLFQWWSWGLIWAQYPFRPRSLYWLVTSGAFKNFWATRHSRGPKLWCSVRSQLRAVLR